MDWRAYCVEEEKKCRLQRIFQQLQKLSKMLEQPVSGGVDNSAED
jgi:hypothetical protein